MRLLAGLSKFVIVDLSSPKSAPYELGAIVSQTMIPFQPIIAAGEMPFSMLQDLWINYPNRASPIHYSSVDALIATLNDKMIRPAEARFVELVRRKGRGDGRGACLGADRRRGAGAAVGHGSGAIVLSDRE